MEIIYVSQSLSRSCLRDLRPSREVDYTQAKWSGRQSEEIVKVSHLDSRSGRTFASNS